VSNMPTLDAAGDRNWIPDVNRFNLPKPPEWFLKVLWDADPGLVLLPSRQGEKYVLGRRREFSRTVAKIALTINERVHARVRYSDSEMLESRGIVRVDAIQHRFGMSAAWGSWMRSCPEIMSDLRKRDMWAAGGAEAYITRLEAEEAAEDAAKRKQTEDDIEYRAADAWRSYQARTGQRTAFGDTGNFPDVAREDRSGRTIVSP
jgi:hypothetical protein